MFLNPCARAFAAGAVFALASCSPGQPIALPGSAQGAPASERGATSGDLMYAGAADGKHIYVFSYPDGKLVKRIASPAGTISLQGLCSDASGNVFVTGLSKPPKSGFATGYVYKYAHGGSKILKTLQFGRARPVGCTVDPVTGTLAVALAGVSSGSGELETFLPGGTGSHTYYSYSIQNFFYCAYDGSGTLYATGQGAGTQMYLAKAKPGQTQLSLVALNQYVSVSGMGQLQWDGTHLTLEDLTADAIYRLKVSGLRADVVAKVPLDGWNGQGLSWIAGSTVILPMGVSGTKIGFWNYPAGGKTVKQVASPSGVFGLTISAGSRQR
jgi:hypothetical protein